MGIQNFVQNLLFFFFWSIKHHFHLEQNGSLEPKGSTDLCACVEQLFFSVHKQELLAQQDANMNSQLSGCL